MNRLLETLNRTGDQALPLAGSLVMQSSLLILVLWAADLLLRRRVRPAVRYGLWLLVPLKLLLPPSLALPTGVGYWLPREAAVGLPTTAGRFEVSYPTGLMNPTPSSIPAPLASRKPARLETNGALLLSWLVGTAGLLGLLLFRTRQVQRVTVAAPPAPPELFDLLDSARVQLGLRQSVGLRLVEDGHSPALCGLWRPVILLPRGLASRLNSLQLRAVLLHELSHARRGDVWVNAVQAVLQGIWWWHPLVWMANARLRGVREEAVDDTVAHELGAEADGYPAALLEVARAALAPRALSLGLVGILESRSALRRRIERLLDRPANRRPGLGWLGIAGIAGVGLLVLPMAEGRPDRSAAVAAPIPEAATVLPDRSISFWPHAADYFDEVLVDPATPRAGVRFSPEWVMSATPPSSNPAPTEQPAGGLDSTSPTLGSSPSGPALEALRLELAQARVDLAAMLTRYKERWPVVIAQREKITALEAQVAQLGEAGESAHPLTRKPPIVQIESHFVSLPDPVVSALGLDRRDGFTRRADGSSQGGTVAGILSDPQRRVLLRALEQRKDVTFVGGPRFTTLSGRQARIISTSSETNHPTSCELDALPEVQPDGRTLRLLVVARATERIQISPQHLAPAAVDDPGKVFSLNAVGYVTRSFTNDVVLVDGETLLVGELDDQPGRAPGPRTVVLVKATLIDPAGNPLHPAAADALP